MPWYCTVAWKPACLHGKRIGSKMNSDKPTHMKIKIKIREKKHLEILMKRWTSHGVLHRLEPSVGEKHMVGALGVTRVAGL